MAQAAEIDLDAQKPAGKKKHLVLYILIALLTIGLAVAVALLLMKDGGKGEEAAAPELEIKPAHYLPLRTMVVNFSEKGPARFLQVDMQVMAHDPAVIAAVETHMPAIRNDVLFLLGAQTYEVVSTREGKEQLREQVKQAIQRILEQHQIKGSIEAVYFTSFVMQ